MRPSSKSGQSRHSSSILEAHLDTEAIPAGIGTFYVFKDKSRRQQFLANRFRRREILPRRRLAELRLAELRLAELRLAETRRALEPLMEVIAALGQAAGPDRVHGDAGGRRALGVTQAGV